MASTREDNPYEGGVGGKFRKRPFKRSQATPYERPPTALRSVARDGWLSKLVDPAQRLITSSAHMFFSTVFRKRLPPPPPPPPLPPLQEAEKDLRDTDHKATSTVPVRFAGTIHPSDSASEKSDVCGVNELEQILKQKTFTRSEIDRLTSLLNSRTIEASSGLEERKSQLASPALDVSHCKENFLSNSAIEDRIKSQAVSTTLVIPSVKVLDEDVASPAEIAKAYMEKRSSKASPLMYGSQTSGYRIESTLQSRHPFPSKTPILPSLPGHTTVSQNGLMTPRSRGRSAIYTMARTPYSRVHSTHAIKNVASTHNYDGPSSSSYQSAWEQGNTSELGPEQGVLKRRSSVLDNNIGSGGPVRRIRQKHNLLSIKGLSSPAYRHPISMNETGVGSEVVHHFQSSNVNARKSLLSGKPMDNLLERSKENGDNALNITSIPSIPSKSREMASKILEQIDKLTPPKEKSSGVKYFASKDMVPTKLSPSMLRGQALESLEKVDSSKYLENIQDNKWSNSSLAIPVPATQNFPSRKQDKLEQNGTGKSLFNGDGSTSVVNDLGSKEQSKEAVPNLIMPVSSVVSSVFHPPQKKRAFQMSAHEDFLDLDEEGYSNAPRTDPLAGKNTKEDGSLTEKKMFDNQTLVAEKPQNSFQIQSTVLPVTDQKSDNSVVSGQISSFIFPTARSVQDANPALSFEQNVFGKELTAAPIFSLRDKVTSLKEQNAPAVLTFEDKVVAPKPPNAFSPVFNFGDKVSYSVDMKAGTEKSENFSLSNFNFASSSFGGEADDLKAGATSASKAEGSNNSLVAVSTSRFDAKESVSDKADNKIDSNFGTISWTSGNAISTSASASVNNSSIFSWSSPASNSNLINGSPFPIAPQFSDNNKVTENLSSDPSLTTATNGSDIANSVPTITAATFTSITPNINFSAPPISSSFPAAPIFKFGSSTIDPVVSAVTQTDSVEAKSKQETSLGNISNTFLSGSSAAVSSNGSSVFGFNAGATSAGAGSGSVFGAPSSGFGVAASTQSIPFQFGSSSTSPSFALAGSQASTGSSLFGSTVSAAKLFNSTSSEATSLSKGSSTNSSVFESSWQPSKSPAFGLTFTSPSQTAFSFGSSTNGASMVFGSSTGAASSSPFSFSSPAAPTSTQNPTRPGFTFGSTTPGMNEQMNMEDSMAEDTVQASTPTIPSFGQQPLSPSPGGFVFGATPPGANPFQFGGQQNLGGTQQNSPFQPSGSLDFNASGGGSFSLGSVGADKANRKFIKVKHKQRKK